MLKKLYSLLCCPRCKNSLVARKNSFRCIRCNISFTIENEVPNFSITIQEEGMKLSQKKWDEKYKVDAKKDIHKELDYLDNKFFSPTWKQISKHHKLSNNDIFLEIGCGTFYLGRHLAKLGKTVVGIDMSMEALQLAKSAFEKKGIRNYLLVCGNVLDMPFKDNSFNLIYGAGVIEHFRDTLDAVRELARVAKKNGVAFNTVPYLNIGSLTYRQVWGNIPRFPVLEPLLTFLHTKILGAKHMRFGYELSFTRSYLEKVHKMAGFRAATTDQYYCELDFDYLPWHPLKNIATVLAKHSPLFWPMIYVAGKK